MKNYLITKNHVKLSRKKLVSISAIILALLLPLLSLNAQAKVFTIQNESVNMLVVNGTTGNILLNPNSGFGNVGILTSVRELLVSLVTIGTEVIL